jgi:phosphopantetheinyl transferase (holo-ACP synthase)
MDENKTAENKKPNIVEIARKKRHLYLYEKLHSGTPLTPAELKELERLEAESDLPNGVVDTKEKVAKALNVSVRTVYYWAKEGMPVTPEGHYDLLEIKAWRMTQQSYRDVRDTEKDKWDIEYRKNKALLSEIDLKKALGEVLPRDEVEKGRIERIMVVKRSFLALPTIMAPLLAMREPREIETLLYEAIAEIIDDFAGERKGHNGEAEE